MSMSIVRAIKSENDQKINPNFQTPVKLKVAQIRVTRLDMDASDTKKKPTSTRTSKVHKFYQQPNLLN